MRLPPTRAAENRSCGRQQSFLSAGVPRSGRIVRLNIKPKPVERLTRIGQERIDQRDAAVAAPAAPLMAKDVVADPKHSTPSVAMASVDGGRMQVRSRLATHRRRTRKVTGGNRRSRSWKPIKALVPADPDPDVPRCFLDVAHTARLVRGLGQAVPTGLEGLAGRSGALLVHRGGS